MRKGVNQLILDAGRAPACFFWLNRKLSPEELAVQINTLCPQVSMDYLLSEAGRKNTRTLSVSHVSKYRSHKSRRRSGLGRVFDFVGGQRLVDDEGENLWAGRGCVDD